MDPYQHISVYFREVQRFRQPWLWAAVLLSPAIFLWAVIQQVILDKPFGSNPSSDASLIIMGILFGVGLPLLFFSIKLVIEVREDGLHIRYYPLHLSPRIIPYSQLESCQVHTYRPIRDYGGWGIKQGKEGKAYNVSGNRGVLLQFVDGKKLLIGSQKPESLASVIDSMIGQSRN